MWQLKPIRVSSKVRLAVIPASHSFPLSIQQKKQYQLCHFSFFTTTTEFFFTHVGFFLGVKKDCGCCEQGFKLNKFKDSSSKLGHVGLNANICTQVGLQVTVIFTIDKSIDLICQMLGNFENVISPELKGTLSNCFCLTHSPAAKVIHWMI